MNKVKWFRALGIRIAILLSVTGASPGLFNQELHAEGLVTDLSSHVIEITSQFSGAELLIFGAIDREIPMDDGGHGVVIEGADYDVVVVVRGENQDMIIRRKEKVGAIWVNRSHQEVQDIPGYYALATTRPLRDILPKDLQEENNLGLDYISISFSHTMGDEEQLAYRQGFIRNMKARGLYFYSEDKVSILKEILFRAALKFPANMPVGDYRAEVYLIRDGEILRKEVTPLLVDKQGLERLIYNFAHDYPAAYGITAIIIALFSGWLGGFLSRKASA